MLGGSCWTKLRIENRGVPWGRLLPERGPYNLSKQQFKTKLNTKIICNLYGMIIIIKL